MTTLAFRDGVLAGDSQMTGNGYVWGHMKKIGEYRGVLYGGAGDCSAITEWRDWVVSGCLGDAPEMTNSVGYLITPLYTLRRSDGGWVRVTSEFWAEGTGEPVATGAMEAGASAIEAVQYAVRRDVNSGGDVQSVSFPHSQVDK